MTGWEWVGAVIVVAVSAVLAGVGTYVALRGQSNTRG